MTQGDDGNRRLFLTLCLIVPFGAVQLVFIPFWIGALTANKVLSVIDAGRLASLELAMLAAGSVAVAFFGDRFRPRVTLAIALALVGSGNAIAMLPIDHALAVGLMLIGFGAGSMSINLRLLASLARPIEAISATSIISLIVQTIGKLCLPVILGQNGTLYFFGANALLAAIILPLMWRGLADTEFSRAEKAVSSGKRRWVPSIPAGIVIAAGLIVILGASGGIRANFLVVIGQSQSFSPSQISYAFAVSGIVGMLGAVIANRLGERVGMIAPLVVSYAVLAVSCIMLIFSFSLPIWTASLSVAAIAAGCATPYLISWLYRIDPSRRLVSLNVALGTLGMSLGTGIGGWVYERMGAHMIFVLSASATTFFLLWLPFLNARLTGRREQAVPA